MKTQLQLAGKRILVVNSGGIRERFILQRLKKSGLSVVLLHKEKNWAQPYVDSWILADTYNHMESVEAVRTFVSNGGEKIDGAITFYEDDVPLLARLCAEFKWIGNTYNTALHTRDKWRMQERLRACGLPAIGEKLLKTKADLEEAILSIGFPAVMKPLWGCDSQFVLYIDNADDARNAYQYLMKTCTPDYDPVYKFNKKLFVYQEFIDGPEFSLECYSQYGVPHVIGMHEKRPKKLPYFLESGDYLPPRVDTNVQDAVRRMTESALIILGVRDSLAHAEVKWTSAGPRVVEIASRMGGDDTWENILNVYGQDLIEIGCAVALGDHVPIDVVAPKQFLVSHFFLPEQSGVVTKIRGMEDVKKEKNISAFFMKDVGDAVLAPPDGYESIGWVSVTGLSFDAAERALADFLRRVTIEVTPFRGSSTLGRTGRKNRFAAASIVKKGMLGLARMARITSVSRGDLRKLHVGVACNIFDSDDPVEQDLMDVGRQVEKVLRERGYRVTFFDFNDYPRVLDELRESDVDIVFNVAERINGSDGLEPHVAGVLESLQIPYTGSNFVTLGLVCLDKIMMKQVLIHNGIPTPRWDYAYSLDERISEDLRYPLIVKPANSHNSIGVTNDSVVTDRKALEKQLSYVIEGLRRPALVEEYIEGDEYEIPIIGNDEEDLRVLAPARWIFKNMPEGYWHIFAFDAKWRKGNVYEYIEEQRPPKNIDKKLESLLRELALDAYKVLGCQDYGRAGIRVDAEGNPYLLEVNPNPSINVNDDIPDSAKFLGMDYGDVIEEILLMALRRYQQEGKMQDIKDAPSPPVQGTLVTEG